MDSHSLEVFGLSQSGRDVDYAKVPDEWTLLNAVRVVTMSASVLHAYLTGLLMDGAMHE